MPLGLFAALVGYVAALRRFAARDSVFLLTLLALRDVLLLQDPHRPGALLDDAALPADHPARRDAAGGVRRVRPLARGRSRLALPAPRRRRRVVVVAILAVQFWTRSAPLFGHVEYAGVIPRLEKLAQTFGDKDLVIVESRDASDVHVLALPLAYVYARNVLLLPNRRPDAATMERFIAWARQQYATVYFVGGGGTELLTKAIAVEPIGTEVFQVPEWSSAWNALPDGARRKEFDFSVYRFIDPPATAGRRRRPRRRRQRRRQRAALPRQGAARQRHHVPLVARRVLHQPAGRHRRRSHAHAGDGRRPPAGPGAAGLGRGLDERSGAGTGHRRPRLQALRRCRFRRRWRRPRRRAARRCA